MDLEKLKSRIREALGAAGMPRGVAEMIDRLIDEEGGKKDAETPKAEPARVVHEEEDDEDEREHHAPAKMAVKPARKTKTARKKK